MKTANIVNGAKRSMRKVGFKLKKHSPEILAAAGVAGVITSGVLACKATTKLSGILEDSKENIDIIHHYMDNPEELNEEYTKEDGQKDLAIVYVQTGVKLVKLYAPAIALGVLSLTALLASNHILRKRNVALAAAYATVDKSFKMYRSRVVERFGDEIDKELRYGIKAVEIKETEVNEEGKKKTVKKTLNIVDPNMYSEFARFYDDGCTGWTKDSEHNLRFLKYQQAFANEQLQEKGFLFLNDVYAMLGIPKTKAGQIVGWVYDEKNPIGDNFIDFGIYNADVEANRDFVNGYERTIILDFNVDGNILDLI